MKVQMLKSKLQRVIVTDANVDYKGSITIDTVLMKAANLLPYERVEVNNATNGSRITTYVLPGTPNSGGVKMNGGAALHAKIGDEVHVLAYCIRSKAFARSHKPIVVHTNLQNKIIKIENE